KRPAKQPMTMRISRNTEKAGLLLDFQGLSLPEGSSETFKFAGVPLTRPSAPEHAKNRCTFRCLRQIPAAVTKPLQDCDVRSADRVRIAPRFMTSCVPPPPWLTAISCQKNHPAQPSLADLSARVETARQAGAGHARFRITALAAALLVLAIFPGVIGSLIL